MLSGKVVMALPLVALGKLVPGDKKFAVVVLACGSCDTLSYVDKDSGSEKKYLAFAGVDQAGDRVSISAFGDAVVVCEKVIKKGAVVKICGAMARIRHRTSASTCNVDLVLERYAKVDLDSDQSSSLVLPALQEALKMYIVAFE